METDIQIACRAFPGAASPPLFGRKANGGAVAKDFRDALRELGGIVPYRDQAVCAERGGVLDHPVVGVLAGALADLGIGFDVAAEDLVGGYL